MFILSILLGILEPCDGVLCSFVVSVFVMLEKCLFRSDALSSGCICNSCLLYGGGTFLLLHFDNDLTIRHYYPVETICLTFQK